ncbi:unnamed protein product [Arabidopsis halleri]
MATGLLNTKYIHEKEKRKRKKSRRSKISMCLLETRVIKNR